MLLHALLWSDAILMTFRGQTTRVVAIIQPTLLRALISQAMVTCIAQDQRQQMPKSEIIGKSKQHLLPARRSGSERLFYDSHDRKIDGSTPTLASFLRPRIRCFTMIKPAW